MKMAFRTEYYSLNEVGGGGVVVSFFAPTSEMPNTSESLLLQPSDLWKN